MSAEPAALPVKSTKPAIPFGVVTIHGKVSQRRKAGNRVLTLLTMPAPDEYSSPSTVEITSAKPLGQVDEMIEVKCRLQGYRRTYKATDPDTGEIRNIATADNRLFHIED